MNEFGNSNARRAIREHELWLERGNQGTRLEYDSTLCMHGLKMRRARLDGANLEMANMVACDLLAASLNSADMRNANLSHAVIEDASFFGAQCFCANFAGAHAFRANFHAANLKCASFANARLCGARFTGAHLDGADFTKADIRGAIGNGKEMVSLQLERWPVVIVQGHMAIGCQQYSIADWWGFSDETIHYMDERHALDWWKKWRPVLETIVGKVAA